MDKQKRIEINLGLDEKKKKKQNAVMAEAGKGDPISKSTMDKYIGITVTPNQTVVSETDLVKLPYDKPGTLTDLRREWFKGLPKVNEAPIEDWQKVFVDLYEVARREDANIILHELDSQANWEYWLGTPIKNPIQQFDK